MPLTIVSKTVKYSGIDLTRNEYRLYKEKYTILLIYVKKDLKMYSVLEENFKSQKFCSP